MIARCSQELFDYLFSVPKVTQFELILLGIDFNLHFILTNWNSSPFTRKLYTKY